MDQLKWSTEKRKISDLSKSDINPRKITKEKKEALMSSLTKFNLADIPVIDTDNTILSGNQRIDVLNELGRGKETIDVRVPNRKLTEHELKEYMLIANTHAGVFDAELLDVHFEDVKIEFEYQVPENITADKFDDKFTLPSGDKSPFQQMTFTLSDSQATAIKNAIVKVKLDNSFKELETENENSNGNALYLIVKEWAEQRK